MGMRRGSVLKRAKINNEIINVDMSVSSVQVIPQLLTKEECSELVQMLEDSPLLQAERNGANYYRSVVFDKDLARKIEKRVKRFIPAEINATEVSDRFRFSKYRPGGKFSLHQDGIYQDPRNGRRSSYTISIFLNEKYNGGETVFYNGTTLDNAREALSVTPETGKAIIFPREVYHCGNEVLDGNKLLLRTDIMVEI